MPPEGGVAHAIYREEHAAEGAERGMHIINLRDVKGGSSTAESIISQNKIKIYAKLNQTKLTSKLYHA